MYRTQLSRLVVVLFVLGWSLSVFLTSASLRAQEAKGKIQKRTYHFEEANKDMEYTLYVPTGYDKTKASPLIVALHGLWSNPRQIIRYPQFVPHAEKHGYIIVAPMGYNSRGWYGMRGKGGGRGSDPENLGELSQKDVMTVLGLIRDEFNIDKNRIYLLGHSMGGGGSLHLAIEYPGIWAAIAPIAPAVPRDPDRLHKAKHIPVIVVQGDKDRLVHGTRRWVEKMKELDIQHKYVEVEGGGHVRVAFEHFPEIFEFFNTHIRSAKTNGGSSTAPEGEKLGQPAKSGQQTKQLEGKRDKIQRKTEEVLNAEPEEVTFQVDRKRWTIETAFQEVALNLRPL